jgi:hypothetical protein
MALARTLTPSNEFEITGVQAGSLDIRQRNHIRRIIRDHGVRPDLHHIALYGPKVCKHGLSEHDVIVGWSTAGSPYGGDIYIIRIMLSSINVNTSHDSLTAGRLKSWSMAHSIGIGIARSGATKQSRER